MPQVVGGQRQLHIAVVARHQLFQISAAGPDILFGIKWIGDTELGGRGRHQLHQPLHTDR